VSCEAQELVVGAGALMQVSVAGSKTNVGVKGSFYASSGTTSVSLIVVPAKEGPPKTQGLLRSRRKSGFGLRVVLMPWRSGEQM
jgi:hypothetical protein